MHLMHIFNWLSPNDRPCCRELHVVARSPEWGSTELAGGTGASHFCQAQTFVLAIELIILRSRQSLSVSLNHSRMCDSRVTPRRKEGNAYFYGWCLSTPDTNERRPRWSEMAVFIPAPMTARLAEWGPKPVPISLSLISPSLAPSR